MAPVKAPEQDTVAVAVELQLDRKGFYLLVRNVVVIDQNRVKLSGKWYNVKGAAFSYGGSLTILLTDLSIPGKQG